MWNERRTGLTRPLAAALVALVTLAALLATAEPARAYEPAPAPAYQPEPPVDKVLKKGQVQLGLYAGGNFMLAGVSQSTLNVLGSVGGSVELGYRLTDELSLLFGLFASHVDVYTTAQAHVTVKYHWLELHSRVKPFVLGGVSHQWLFPTPPPGKDRKTITSAGVRVGTGLDFVLTPRLLFALIGAFDMGPRLLPNVGVYGTFKLQGGVTFVF